jgi:simple sugar transport system ATP-binding protein
LRALSEQTGFVFDPDAKVETLSIGAQQRAEIAKALMRRARLLVLDEPTAVLPPSESAELLRWLRDFADQGNAAVLITHKLGEALSVADDVTVLRRGRTVLAVPRASATAESLTDAMLGAPTIDERTNLALTEAPRQTIVRSTIPIFRADRASLTDPHGIVRIRQASFTIAAGEIVGVVGVEGAGHRELLRALAGRQDVVSGALEGPPVVGFVPEDRHRDAVLLDRRLTENVALRGAGKRRGIIDWRAIARRTEALMRAFDVRAAGSRALMRTLSGGNQQKLVLARELDSVMADGPQAIVVENPTRGLDVRASAEVHARLRAARDAGAAVVLYSSDIDEVLALANRVLVVYAGTVSETAPDRELVGRRMLGLEAGVAS